MELLIIAFILLLIFFIWFGLYKFGFTGIESGAERAGRKGEIFATQIIDEILNEKDVLLTNINMSFEGKDTELDNVIINNRGVFIIEVKNYSGTLYGDEDDYEWIKRKVSRGGNIYQKTVNNPIRQVKRQIYILSNYLKQYGINVWVEGYVFLVEMNSPIESGYILNTRNDIDNAIHLKTNNKLTNASVDRIIELLEELNY